MIATKPCCLLMQIVVVALLALLSCPVFALFLNEQQVLNDVGVIGKPRRVRICGRTTGNNVHVPLLALVCCAINRPTATAVSWSFESLELKGKSMLDSTLLSGPLTRSVS